MVGVGNPPGDGIGVDDPEDPSFLRTMLNTFSKIGGSPARLVINTRFPPYTPFSVKLPAPLFVPLMVNAM